VSAQGTVENPGINQRALKHLFNEIEERKDMWTYTVSVSSVEIYNEVLRYCTLPLYHAKIYGGCHLNVSTYIEHIKYGK